MTEKQLTVHNILREEIEHLTQVINSNFGERDVKNFFELAKKTELETDYKNIEDIESLIDIIRSLAFFIDMEYKTKSIRG